MNTADVERVKHAILEKAKERGIWLEDKYTNREQVATELARAAIATMQTWQSIEDIPDDWKNGRAVMLGGKGWSGEGRWKENSVSGWYLAQTDPTDYVDGQIYPTHYQAMPAPPEDG